MDSVVYVIVLHAFCWPCFCLITIADRHYIMVDTEEWAEKITNGVGHLQEIHCVRVPNYLPLEHNVWRKNAVIREKKIEAGDYFNKRNVKSMSVVAWHSFLKCLHIAADIRSFVQWVSWIFEQALHYTIFVFIEHCSQPKECMISHPCTFVSAVFVSRFPVALTFTRKLAVDHTFLISSWKSFSHAFVVSQEIWLEKLAKEFFLQIYKIYNEWKLFLSKLRCFFSVISILHWHRLRLNKPFISRFASKLIIFNNFERRALKAAPFVHCGLIPIQTIGANIS